MHSIARVYCLLTAIAGVLSGKHLMRPITIEQEETLARLAAASKLTKKDWRLLLASGLVNSRNKLLYNSSSVTYIRGITLIHCAHMNKHQISSWSSVLWWSRDFDLTQHFNSKHKRKFQSFE